MNVLAVLIAVIGTVACAEKKYVFDFLKPALTAEEVNLLIGSKGYNYPTYSEIPVTRFSCASKKMPGFYADVEGQCQLFHRCSVDGVQTSYLCTNQTLFNQITLACDYWYHVDCDKSADYEYLANANLYKVDQPMYESPPKDYISPYQQQQAQAPSYTGTGLNNQYKPPNPYKGSGSSAGKYVSGSASSSSSYTEN